MTRLLPKVALLVVSPFARRTLPVAVVLLLVAGSPAHATLIDYGGGLIYDPVQDLTWLDPSYGQPQHKMVKVGRNCGALPCDWNYTWLGAYTWTKHFVYEGYEDWRLPHMRYGGDNELHAMLEQISGWEFTTEQGEPYLQTQGERGPFASTLPYWGTWLDSPYTYTSPAAGGGYDIPDFLDATRHVIIVRNGAPTTPIPEPSTLLLMGLGAAAFVTQPFGTAALQGARPRKLRNRLISAARAGRNARSRGRDLT